MKYLFATLSVLLFPMFFIHAQSTNLQYGDQQATIDLEPLFPAPESTFTASINDYALPVQGVGIRWYVDGKELTDFTNVRTITLTNKKLGEKTTIKAEIPLPGGSAVNVVKIVTPVYLDVIIEPQTRIAAFYAGRALPSVGSTVNATAILNGSNSSGNLLYTWRLNNTVLEGGSVRNKDTVTFTMPQGPYATLSLEVRTGEGEAIARRIFDITNHKPELVFYEVNTLYGLKQKALIGDTPLVGSSMTIRAEPYFLDVTTYNNPDHLEWKIGGTKTVNTSINPYEITLASQGGGGSTAIDFHVRNTVQLLQGAQGNFSVSY